MRGLINTVLVMACAAVGATTLHKPETKRVTIEARDVAQPVFAPAVLTTETAAKCGCKGECQCTDANYCRSLKCAKPATTIPTKPASNKTIAPASQTCRINADGSKSCSAANSSKGQGSSCASCSQSAGPVRRVFQNRPRLFRRRG